MGEDDYMSSTVPHESSATAAHWLEGTRPRTWANAFAPVIVASGVAAFHGGFLWWKALLALVVAWALIIGVNYANDYSDGIRGTDEDRTGPLRLTGSGLAQPGEVKKAAFISFGIAGIAGLALHHQRLVAGRHRCHLHPGRLVLHRWLQTLWLHGTGRGGGLRLLRPGGGAGY